MAKQADSKSKKTRETTDRLATQKLPLGVHPREALLLVSVLFFALLVLAKGVSNVSSPSPGKDYGIEASNADFSHIQKLIDEDHYDLSEPLTFDTYDEFIYFMNNSTSREALYSAVEGRPVDPDRYDGVIFSNDDQAAFYNEASGEFDVFVSKSEYENRGADEGFYLGSLVMSPDGMKIAYTLAVGDVYGGYSPRTNSIQVYDVATGETTILTPQDGETLNGSINWSPDSRFVSYVEGYTADRLIMKDVASGSEVRRIEPAETYTPSDEFLAIETKSAYFGRISNAVWLSDTEYIYYSGGMLLLANVNNSGADDRVLVETGIINNGAYEGPIWSSSPTVSDDGNQIIYHTDNGTYLYDLDAGSSTQLSSELSTQASHWLVGNTVHYRQKVTSDPDSYSLYQYENGENTTRIGDVRWFYTQATHQPDTHERIIVDETFGGESGTDSALNGDEYVFNLSTSESECSLPFISNDLIKLWAGSWPGPFMTETDLLIRLRVGNDPSQEFNQYANLVLAGDTCELFYIDQDELGFEYVRTWQNL